jgi:hypothetical protein
LKRLKFINDLPNILESKLNEYISNKETKDLKILEKSLIYYEKCKQFLNLHKNNVKFIYYIYYNIIYILVFSKRYIF